MSAVIPARRRRIGRRVALLLVIAAVPAATGAVFPVVPPCAGALPEPAYAPLGGAPTVRTWSDGRLADFPALGTCLGWKDGDFRTLVAIAGTFRAQGGKSELLTRFGAVSGLLLVRYWSTSDREWLPLVTAAAPLTGAINGHARADFTSTELASGRDLYMSQRDNRVASDVIYRMRVRESGANRVVIETENTTPVRWWALTLFKPGALHSVYFLEQRSADVWSYYALTKISDGSWIVSGHEKSYINRVVALYRHLAGVPTDLEPPAAP